jgi:hypothetical protein
VQWQTRSEFGSASTSYFTPPQRQVPWRVAMV